MTADLDLVVPAYNEEVRLPSSLARLKAFGEELHIVLRLIVVDDGSTDGTAAVVERCCDELSESRFSIELVRTAHRGKGAAVRAGMSLISAPVVAYCDADLSAGPDAIAILYRRVANGVDVALASRGIAGAELVVRQPWYRERAGKLFNVALRALTGLKFRDTQCGLKVFTNNSATRIFQHQRLDGFAFDTEVVVLAQRMGFTTVEVPIRWAHDAGTKVSLVRDSITMAADLVRTVRRLRTGTLSPAGVPTESAIDMMAFAEDTHWWHRAKRRLVLDLLKRAGATGPCLDVGSGGGALIAELEHEMRTVGVDLSPRSLAHARARGIRSVALAEAETLPFRSETFGCALALDVLEHSSRPERVAVEIRRVLRPGGLLIVTVPAFRFMWSYADHVLGHYRRYTKRQLTEDLERSGLTPLRVSYFHSWLLPIAWIVRKLRPIVGKAEGPDDFPVPRLLNSFLFGVSKSELRLLARSDLPFGLSILAVARNGSDPEG